MEIFNAVILGIVQGLTEFLPVSSSGHLVLLQKIFDVKEPELFFDTMLHFGTLIAVFIVLWKDIWELIKKPIQPLTGYIILGTIPAVIAALLFRKPIENLFTSAQFLGICFLITTALLISAELLYRRAKNTTENKSLSGMNWLDALLIGLMQAIAIPPGISRSGATISGALFRRLDRDSAARFSFLLSIPAILGAVALHSKDLVKDLISKSPLPQGFEMVTVSVTVAETATATEAATTAASFGPLAVIIGTITAGLVGFFAIKIMLKIIREKSLFGFAIYTGVLGVFILFDQLVTKFIFS